MSQSKASGRKSVAGMGSIRKKEKVINGKAYTYYEARYTVGIDPGTGKQIQKSISGKTQREVARRLKEITTSIDAGTYLPSCKLTVGEWLNGSQSILQTGSRSQSATAQSKSRST